jgi:hypothetical protein
MTSLRKVLHDLYLSGSTPGRFARVLASIVRCELEAAASPPAAKLIDNPESIDQIAAPIDRSPQARAADKGLVHDWQYRRSTISSTHLTPGRAKGSNVGPSGASPGGQAA